MNSLWEEKIASHYIVLSDRHACVNFIIKHGWTRILKLVNHEENNKKGNKTASSISMSKPFIKGKNSFVY